MSLVEPTRGIEHTGRPGELAADLGWPNRLHEWTTTVDHKKIGIMYVLMSVVFLVIGGIEAMLMRWQLFFPRNNLLGHDTFNQLFTMHGTTMVFFVGMPILIGIGNYLVPLMIGARDMAFPRLNAFGFWVTLFGGLMVYLSFITGGAPAVGWFAYAPLTSNTFSPSAATDFWALGLIVSGIGTHRRCREFHRHDTWHASAGHDLAQSCRSSCGRCSGQRSRCCWRSRPLPQRL